MGLLLLFIETLVAHIGAAFGPGLGSATLLAGNRRLRLLGPALGRPAFWLVFSQVGSAELRRGGRGGRSGRCGYLAGVGHARIALFDTGGLLIGSGLSC